LLLLETIATLRVASEEESGRASGIQGQTHRLFEDTITKTITR